MQTLSVRELRAGLSNLEQIFSESEEIVLTRHSKPIARILPIQRKKSRPSHKELRDSIPPLNTPSEVLQREEREDR